MSGLIAPFAASTREAVAKTCPAVDGANWAPFGLESDPSYKKPGAAETARARHRRDKLLCATDLTAALESALTRIVRDHLGPVLEMRDLRHREAAAWPDLSDYLDELAFEGYADRTIGNYERQIAWLLVEYPALGFGDFTKTELMRVLGRVPDRSRPGVKSTYKSWFAWGVRDDRIPTNPADRIRKLKPGPARPSNIFTEAEVAILTSRPCPDGPLWALLFGLGLRKGDALKLRRDRIDLDRMRVTLVNGKGGKDALIPFTPAVAAAVAELDLTERLNPGDYLWYRPSYKPGRNVPVGPSTFNRWYADELEAAGIPYRNPHQTRHTFHWLLRHVEQLDLEERQILMRHDSPVTTVRQYGAVDIEDIARKRAAVTV